MKIDSQLTGSGKLGNVVYSKYPGATVARAYNPTVANPSTSAQVNQRAKMKLMSQLSAAMSNVIAIPKKGMQSARNRFVQINFSNTVASDGVAQVTYENLQLTDGNVQIPSIIAERSNIDQRIEVELSSAPAADIKRIVYVAFRKTESQMEYVGSTVVSVPGENGRYAGNLPYETSDVILYAYGMKDTSSKASAKYANYDVQNGTDIARLVANRAITAADYSFTATRGATLPYNSDSLAPLGPNEARVYLTPVGNGTVNGAGVYTLGDQVSVTATPATGWHFVGWQINGRDTIHSASNPFGFVCEGTVDLLAIFERDDDELDEN